MTKSIKEIMEWYDGQRGVAVKVDFDNLAYAFLNIGILSNALKTCIAALEYYQDKNGGPYAPGDCHTADGGKTAYDALTQIGWETE